MASAVSAELEGPAAAPIPKPERESISWDDMDKTRYFTAGAIMFTGVRAITFPLVLVKTRLQVQRGNSQYTGFTHAATSIVRSEGIRGLYKGFLPSTLNPILRQVYFGGYEWLRQFIGVANAQLSAPLKPEHLEPLRNFTAGILASTAYQVVTNPVDVVSQRMMMEGVASKESKARGRMMHVISDIWQNQGLRGFYRGFWISTAQFGPSSSVWWMCYEEVARRLHPRLPTEWSARSRDLTTQVVGSFAAGCGAVIISNPVDVVRTRLQVDKSANASIGQTYRTLMAESGWRGLFKGVGARMASFGPVSVLILSVYEAVKRIARKTPEERAAAAHATAAATAAAVDSAAPATAAPASAATKPAIASNATATAALAAAPALLSTRSGTAPAAAAASPASSTATADSR